MLLKEARRTCGEWIALELVRRLPCGRRDRTLKRMTDEARAKARAGVVAAVPLWSTGTVTTQLAARLSSFRSALANGEAGDARLVELITEEAAVVLVLLRLWEERKNAG